MDCYSPGQGLMPASFKVRSVPLDGQDGIPGDVLDPDFGESAIGRVAPVDSGLYYQHVFLIPYCSNSYEPASYLHGFEYVGRLSFCCLF